MIQQLYLLNTKKLSNMKTQKFRSIRSCVHYIDNHLNNGDGSELSVNDALYFGTVFCIYCYFEDALLAKKQGFKVFPQLINNHTTNRYILSWLEVYEFVKYLKQRDGYLIIQ